MSVTSGLAGTPKDLSASQRAVLEERLQRARRTSQRSPESRTSIPRRPAGAELPLSLGQERLWFLDQLEPGTPVYNLCHAVRLQGPLVLPALEQALNLIVARHESLRTNFQAEDGRPLQVVSPVRVLSLVVADLTKSPVEHREAELKTRLQAEARRPFDLATDSLIRALVVRLSPLDHVVLLTMHHIISDGWSLGVLFRELAKGYVGFCRGESPVLTDLPVQFGDYALWERQQFHGLGFAEALSFWKQQLGGVLPNLELPIDHPRSSTAVARGALRSLTLSNAVTEGIKSLGQQEGATLFMTLLAAFNVLLYRWTGADDIVVGSVVAGRRKVELEKLIGFFVNTIVLRSNLKGDPTFRTLLQRVRDFSFSAIAHQDLPFDVLVQELRPDRAVSRNPLFQVMFVVQNAASTTAEMPNLAVETLDVDTATAKFDLTLSVVEAPEGLRVGLEYNADLFEAATIEGLLGCFERLVASIVAGPDRAIADLAWVSPSEQQRIVREWNRTAVDFPRDRTIHDVIEARVAAAPDRPALSFAGTTLTYQELNDRANQLAHHLRAAGVGPDTLVAICFERSPRMIIALLAILKAGGAYVALDPSYPPDRLAFMLADAQPPVVLTTAALRRVIPAGDGTLPAFRIIETDTKATEIGLRPTANPEPLAGATHLAYVCYTSGSTGRPKGVGIIHRAVLRLLLNVDYIDLGPEDVFTQLSNSAFDASTFEIWGSLMHGGRLVIVPPAVILSPPDLFTFLAAEGVTVTLITTAVFNQLVEFRSDFFRSLRVVLFGGEAANASAVRAVLRGGRPQRLINAYGPTEATTLATTYEVRDLPADAATVPIGRPIANTTVYVLDPRGQPVPVGVAGELYIGGVGVARGYLRRPELTAERFVADPFEPGPEARLYRTGDRVRWRPDGNLEFIGRFDRQVKIRGFRIELGEIETVLERHPRVKQAVVEIRESDSGDYRLVAYVAAADTALEPTELRHHLQTQVAEHMIPGAWVILDTLPLNANGKVDRAALPAPQTASRAEHVAPRDDTERQLVEVWSAVLSVERVGVRDRFFELGGHSLLAVQMVARLEKAFGKKLPVAAIFQHGTIEELAPLLRSGATSYASATSIVAVQAQGERPPLYLVHGVGGGMFWGYANLARHLGPEQPLLAFKSRGLEGLPEFETIEELAAQYVADLRTRQAAGPYRIGGYCFGGIVAYEMARQLEAMGETAGVLALINCSPPNTPYDRIPQPTTWRWRMKFVRNVGYWLGCVVFRWTLAERLEFARWKWRVLRKRFRGGGGRDVDSLGVTDLDEMVNLDAYSEDQRRLWQTHVNALRRYQPQPYGGRVTLLRTCGHALRCSFEDHYGWGPLAGGGVTVLVVPGGHGNILDEPHVQMVARALERELIPDRGASNESPVHAKCAQGELA